MNKKSFIEKSTKESVDDSELLEALTNGWLVLRQENLSDLALLDLIHYNLLTCESTD